jgi:hypothetical protein
MTCENSTLQSQIDKLQTELEHETSLKSEFTKEFEAIKKRIGMVQQWEDEASDLRKKNDWLSN